MIDYDPHVWRNTFFAMHGSRLGVISLRSLVVTVAALALTLVHVFVTPISSPAASAVHSIVAPALGLLLVFRTNQSYDRWWEGRRLWGTMVNTVRNLARGVSVHLVEGGRRERVLLLVREFPAACISVLRATTWTPGALEAEELAFVRSLGHVPVALCTRVSWHLKAARDAGELSDFVMTSLDHHAQQLVDVIGACERIHKTPLPFAYVVHLRRALVLYCSTLPFALLGSFGWSTVPIVFAVTAVLLGIEEIGVEIEDPFEGDANDLPLEQMTAGMQATIDAFRAAPR